MSRCAAAASGLFAALIFSAVVLAQAPAGSGAAPGGAPGGGQGGRGGLVAYPPRPPGDPAAVERGKTLWGVNCTFCHGPDARGGDGGPNLLRSAIMLDDQKGELIAPVVQKGLGAMPPLALTMGQIQDIAAFLHTIPISSRTGPSTINILIGDPKKGEAYVAQKCASCHTTEALTAFAGKLDDPRMLQQMWLMPGSGGRAGAPSNAPIPAPPVTAIVTLPSGERVEGRVERIDDFMVSLVTHAGELRTFRTSGTTTKVELRDPLQGHKDLLPVYTDPDIHNVTAYIASLKGQR
jgi:mono/diheme cytochrome c family protein